MNESRRKMLTEDVLGKCWHEPREYHSGLCCSACDELAQEDYAIVQHCDENNPTFTTREDTMDLYEAIAEKGLWQQFYQYVSALEKARFGEGLLDIDAFICNRLFCLTTKDCAAACDRVADFFEERGLK